MSNYNETFMTVPDDFHQKAISFFSQRFEDCEQDDISEMIHDMNHLFVQKSFNYNQEQQHDEPVQKQKGTRKVSAYNMWKKSKQGGDWSSLDNDTKMMFQQQADEVNSNRQESIVSTSGSCEPKNKRRVSAYNLWKKSKTGGNWNNMTDEEKSEWYDQANELNSGFVPATPKAQTKKFDIAYESHKIALKYLRTNKIGYSFPTWRSLSTSSKETWADFARENLDESLDRQTIYSGADNFEDELQQLKD